MNAADRDRRGDDGQRLLVVDPRNQAWFDATVGDLPQLLRPGDLLVVNDAATFPGSVAGAVDRTAIELRLAAPPEDGLWPFVLFGAGDWRTDTDRRPAPPRVGVGRLLEVAGLVARVAAVSPRSPRLVTLRFDVDEADAWAAIYRTGRPVQYSYLRDAIDLFAVQTRFAARPWAAEMPSAGRPLTWSTLLRLREHGVGIAALTHAAGLSATGDPALDAALPLPERYEIPAATVAAVERTLARERTVIAVGTTVVRALEGSARTNGGHVLAGAGTTDLVIGPGFAPRVVGGLLSGMHDAGTSHFRVLTAFDATPTLPRATAHATERGYLVHEFGDSTLVLPGAAATGLDAAA